METRRQVFTNLWLALTLSTLVAVVVTVSMGHRARHIVATRIDLVDSAGRPAASIRYDDGLRFTLFAPDSDQEGPGSAALVLRSPNAGGGLWVYSPTGKAQVLLDIKPD
ncbi:MAG TPA: hypothetical protein DCZ72_11635 [Armatimonadetes bacterium]|nr:hypothetical protein [Armatimonadota bacterium]